MRNFSKTNKSLIKNADMKKLTLMISLLVFAVMGFGQKSFHDFVVKDISGQEFDLKQLKGKKVLVVNTASKCGLTPQYEDLEKLYNEYKNQNFVIIGFPANNFMNQEPGTNEEISEFCEKNYGVSFPMMSKISVKGDDMHPLYEWLTNKEKNGKMDSKVSWNFQKYMINEAGKLVGYVKPRIKPYNEEIIAFIED